MEGDEIKLSRAFLKWERMIRFLPYRALKKERQKNIFKLFVNSCLIMRGFIHFSESCRQKRQTHIRKLLTGGKIKE